MRAGDSWGFTVNVAPRSRMYSYGLSKIRRKGPKDSVRATHTKAIGFILSVFKGGKKHTEYLECASQPPMDKESSRAGYLRINGKGRMDTLSQ